MKRYELKRKTPMPGPRKPMRQRSETNSRPVEDIGFRQMYLANHPHCQLAPFLCGVVSGVRTQETAIEVHHAFGSRKGRHDNGLNCVAVCRVVHRWLHDNPKEGRLLCVWLKCRAGVFDAITFRSISGKYLPGFLDWCGRPAEPRLAAMWDELQKFTEGVAK